MSTIKTNSLRAWFLAARPKTLTAAAVPVMLAVALALRDCASRGMGIQWLPATLCLAFAWVMQIDSNLVNDYFDFKHGNDDETRLGPKRACAEGWVTMGAMKRAIALTTLLGCAIGLPLVIFGGWEMVVVGICCVVFCFLYTTTLSYLGLGDLLVLAFFGIVPVCCSYYLVMPTGWQGVTPQVALTSVASGLVVDTLLVVNNYRDFDNDRRSGKNTLIVIMGKRKAELFYLSLGIVPILVMLSLTLSPSLGLARNIAVLLMAAAYTVLHLLTSDRMRKIGAGKELNKVLGLTARNIFIFGILVCLMILCTMS